MEPGDGVSLGWSGVDALMSMFDTADAAEETGAPDTAPRAASKFEAPRARARLYDGRIPYAEKATEADGLIRDLAGWKPEDGDDAGALQLANVLVEWSLAVLSYGGLGARPVKGKAKKGGGANNNDDDAKKRNGPPPPRAAGADPPTPQRLCVDTTLWAALRAGMAHGENRPEFSDPKVTPAVAATSHVMLAATAAANESTESENNEDDSDLPSLVAGSLGLIRARLQGDFKPAPEQCLACAAACVPKRRTAVHRDEQHRDPWRALTDECFGLFRYMVKMHGAHKPAPDVPDNVMRQMLMDAVGDVENVAARAARCVMLHPTHLSSIPAAFAAAGGKPVTPSTTPPAKRRKKGGKKGGDGDDDDGGGAEGGADPTQSKVWNKSLPAPRFIQNAAIKVVTDDDCVRLAPWLFRCFVEDSNDAASRAGKKVKESDNFVPKPGRCHPAVQGDARLLWDALFEPVASFELDSFDNTNAGPKSDSSGDSSRRRKGNTNKGTRGGNNNVRRDATGRRRVAAALVRAADVANLYSYTGLDDSCPAPDRLNVRGRMDQYADALFSVDAKRGARRITASKAATCAAATAMLEVDVRIVEPHCSAIVAEVCRCENAEQRDGAAATQLFTSLVKQYAATRQLPTLLTKFGAAVASLRDEDADCESKFVVGDVLDHPAVLATFQGECERMLSGMISEMCACAHGAMSVALGACEWGSGANGRGHGARCAALGAVIATVFRGLPAEAGKSLDDGARVALEEFCAEISGRLRDWFDSSRSGGPRSGETKNKKGGHSGGSNDAGFGDASIAGALLSVYVQAQAILEICHDRKELYSFHEKPYLGDDAPPILDVVRAILAIGDGEDELEGIEGVDAGVVGADVAAGKARATSAAGAALQRVVQLAKVADPPPAGVSDPAAIAEARSLVHVCATCAGSTRRTPTAAAVHTLMASCQELWMPYAEAGALKVWVRGGSEDVFRDKRLLKLWTREAVRGVVAACDGVCVATKFGANARAIVDEVSAGAEDETEEVAWSRWESTHKLAAKFWTHAADDDAWGPGAEDAGKKGKKGKGAKKTAGGSSSADVNKVTDSLEALRAAIERLAKMPPQVVDDCDARWLVAACVAADCAAFSSAASRVDSSSNTPAILATIDVMTAARKAMATLAAADEASAAFALAGSTSDKRAILTDASLAMTARVQRLLMEASGASSLGVLTPLDPDARTMTCAFAYATSAFVQVTTQAAKGEVFFKALHAVNASVTPAVKDAARHAHAVLLAAIERVEAKKVKRRKEREAAEAATKRAKMTPRAVKLNAGKLSGKKTDPPASTRVTHERLRFDGGSDDKDDTKGRDAKPRDPPPDVGIVSVMALALAEAALAAASQGVASFGVEKDESSFELNDIKEKMDAIEFVGPASAKAWACVESLRVATVDEAMASLAKLAKRSPPGVTDALSSSFSAAASSAGLAEMGIAYSKQGEKSRIVPEPDTIRRGLTHACGVLRDCTDDGWIVKYPNAAAKAVNLIRATVDVFSAAGPHLTATAHACILATVMSTYDVSARHVRFGTDDQLPHPPYDLNVALNRAMGSCLHGAGKRLLGAGYRACIAQLRAADSIHRTLYPFGRYALAGMSEAKHKAMGFDTMHDGWETASSVAAPLWCMQSLCNHTGWGGKAARLAATEHAEYACNTLMDCARMATEKGSCGVPGGSPSRAVAWAAVNALTTVSGRGKGTPLSSRCCSRMAVLPQTICEGLVSVDSGNSLFAGCCQLVSALLRCRTHELKRCSAMYTISCQYLLDAMRKWNAEDIENRRARGEATQEAKDAEIEAAAISDDALTREWQRITAIEERESADEFARKMRVAATHMVPVYENVNKGKLGTIYCQHLLADAITACTGSAVTASKDGGSIGAVAERALKPGIFALMDAVGDREFQELHSAFVSGHGGARRMVLRKFIDEYRRTHKFDGKI